MTLSPRSEWPRPTATAQEAPAVAPEVNHASRSRRAAAARAGDSQHASLSGGTGFRRAEARPAGEVAQRLTAVVRR